jgi:hypothetical protein
VHKQQRITLLSLLAAAALLASSCDNSFGVFASIQEEVAQSGTGIFKNSTVTRAFAFGASYYATQTKLYSRTIAGGSWGIVSIDGSADYTCLSATTDGSSVLYVATGDSAATNAVYSSAGGATWSGMDTAALAAAGSVVDNLFFANGYLFAEAHEKFASETPADHTYTLYYWNGSAFVAVNASLTSSAEPFVGVVWDGASFWYATRDALYQGTTAAPPFAMTSITAAGPVYYSATITSIAYSEAASALYVGTYSTYLYQYASSSWTRKTVGSGGPLSAIVDVGGGSSHLLVGEGFTEDDDTDGGYYEGTYSSFTTGDSGAVAHSESIYDTTVNGIAVNDFFWDAANNTLFVCLSSGASSSLYGLYSSVYDGSSSWTGWDAE